MQSNLHPFYQNAALLLNLTIPEQCIETFGMTILEGMTYALPSIVPPIGGPLELVENGINGFTIDSREIDSLKDRITELYSNENLYNILSLNSLMKAKGFYPEDQNDNNIKKILKI